MKNAILIVHFKNWLLSRDKHKFLFSQLIKDYIYFLECASKSLVPSWTNNLEKYVYSSLHLKFY
jgi:hypothetical protein